MGLIRKTVKLSTLGLAPIHYRDKQERIIKANERQLRVQRKMLEQQGNAAVVAHTDTRTDDLVEQLEALGRLRNQGVLTDNEFEQQKSRLLGR